MRTTGIVSRADVLRPHDHVSWVFDDPSSFIDASVAFLRDGLRRGERVAYVGGVGLDHMADELHRLARHEGGDAFVDDLDGMYQGGTPNAEEQAAIYVDATRAALRDGRTGLRVAADCTPLVRDEVAAQAFARYEHLVDREMVDLPFTAMCGVDRAELGDRVDRLACLHPATNLATSTFGVYARERDVLGLRGDLDVGNEIELDLALQRAGWPALVPAVLDASDLGYLDHHALAVLHRRLVDADATTRLRTTSTLVPKLVELLRYGRIEVEVIR